MHKIIIDFSGTLVMEPENIKFVNIHENGPELVISGPQWLTLNEDERNSFVIESLATALDDLQCSRQFGDCIGGQ